MKPYLVGKVLIVLLLVTAMSMSLEGQVTAGEIFGTVTDSGQASVSGANVVATDLSKGTRFTAVTNDSGAYTIRNLVPDNYSVEFTASGFRTLVRSMVIVQANAAAQVNAALQVGQVSEKVEVTGAAPLLQVDSGELSVSFTANELSKMPVVNRNYTAMQLTTPGTVYTGWSIASSENPQSSSQIQVNGQNYWATDHELDGTNNEDRVLGLIVVNPNLDSVQEATVINNSFDAQYGNATGAVMTAQTKSGTNQFHGTVFDFLQNDQLFQARDPFSQTQPDPITGRTLPPLRYNQFGANLGGPIKKDKVFFFGDYQGTRRRRSGTVVTFVPTAAERAGDFSAITVPIFDPTTGNPDGTGRTQFSDKGVLNVIPADRISPAARNILNALPLPNFNGTGSLDQNFLGFGTESFNADSYNTREDWFVNDRMQAFGRYSLQQFDLHAPTAFGDELGGPSLKGVNLGGISQGRTQSLAAGFNYSFTSSFFTNFRLGFFRYRVNVNALNEGQDLANQFGIPGINLGDPFTSGFPAMDIQGFGGQIGETKLGDSNFNASCNCPLRENEWQIQFVSNWVKESGNHEFKWGADIRHLSDFRFSSSGIGNGQYNFTNVATSQSGVSNSGFGLAGFLIGAVSNFQRIATPFQASSSDAPATRMNMPFFYGQDKWRVTRTLTLTAGLRWELYLPQYVNKPGRGGWFNFDTGNAIVAGYGPYGLNGGVQASYKTFAPRLGIAWQTSPRTVVRAGYGRGYSSGNFGIVFGNAASVSYPVWVTQAVNPTNIFQPVFSLDTAPPSALDLVPPVSAYQSTGEVAVPPDVTIYAYPRRQIIPTVDSWNLTVERQLASNTSFALSYVGNKGTHVDVGGNNLNVSPVTPPIDSTLGSLYQAPYYLKNGMMAPVYSETSGQSSNYNALQVSFRQRPLKGLDVQANFTWSKAMGYNGAWQYGLKYGYGPVAFDVSKNFNLIHTYELPFGKSRTFLNTQSRAVDAIVGGWTLNGIWNFRTGEPTNATYDGSGCFNCLFTAWPDIVGNPYAGGGSQDHFWNAAAFRDVPDSHITGVQRQGQGESWDNLRGPGFWIANLSMFKAFDITERVNAQLSFEFYNAFNHVNWAMPDTFINSPTFGKVTATQQYQQDQNAMRSGQVGLKISF